MIAQYEKYVCNTRKSEQFRNGKSFGMNLGGKCVKIRILIMGIYLQAYATTGCYRKIDFFISLLPPLHGPDCIDVFIQLWWEFIKKKTGK